MSSRQKFLFLVNFLLGNMGFEKRQSFYRKIFRNLKIITLVFTLTRKCARNEKIYRNGKCMLSGHTLLLSFSKF
jgi:hypothetical protein